MEPLCITGFGIVSAIGLNAQETLASLRDRRSGIGPLRYLKTAHNDLPCGEVPLSDAQLLAGLQLDPQTVTTRTILLGQWALREAMKQAGLDGNATRWRKAFVSGTTVGGMEKSEQYYLDFLENDSKNAFIRTHDCGSCTQAIADFVGGFDCTTTLSTACSSAANAFITGADMIRTGRAQIAVVGGSECLTKFHLNGFNTLMILDHQLCRPFDATRAGLNLGEGAAYLVLETAATARERGVKPLAWLCGYGNACDAFHQTASSPDGEGAYLAMKEALAQAGIAPSAIDYVNAHGTGTPNNDVSEGTALMRLFGRDTVPSVSSTKAFTGHTTSASGSLEAVIAILALQHQFLPVNLHFEHPMPELSFTPVTQSTPTRPLRYVLNNSFGFGGNDTSCLFAKAD